MRTTFHIRVVLLGITAAGLLHSPLTVAHEKSNLPTQTFESALLAGDWPGVAAVTRTDSGALDAAVLGAIRGHAMLALNENCDALRLFLSLSNEVARQAWGRWTEAFADEHRSNAVALYLRGDALARLGQWAQAVGWYTNALAIAPRLALAHNALGVAHVRLSKPELALEDFERACRLAPEFADAHASLGAFWLLREAPEGALTAFKLALARSPSGPLALVGHACATIGFSPDAISVEMALTNLAAALPCESVGPLAAANFRAILGYAGNHGKEDELKSEGMTLKTRNMLFRDDSITQDQLRRFSTTALLDAYNRFGRNSTHSERWGGIVDKVSGSAKGFGLDLKQWSVSSFRDSQDWRRLEGQAYRELKRRDIDVFQGGARTEDLGRAYMNRGHWPFTVWFGLAQ